MKSFPKPLSTKEEYEYLDKCKQGDREARNILIERNMRLVAHIVKKYNMNDKENEDLLSIGTIGLIKAIDTFNQNKNIRLATYASKCIDNEILMWLRSNKKQSKDVYLYEPIGSDKEGNEISLLDIIEAEDVDIVENIQYKENVKRLYYFIDAVLTQREKNIIKLRYGLNKNKEITQRELAKSLGISRSYVSRLEKKALEKLRNEFEKQLKK